MYKKMFKKRFFFVEIYCESFAHYIKNACPNFLDFLKNKININVANSILSLIQQSKRDLSTF